MMNLQPADHVSLKVDLFTVAAPRSEPDPAA
jgi:hypothetical protein